MKGLKSTLMVATAALLVGIGATAEALPLPLINGEIQIDGSLTTTTNLLTTTEIHFSPSAPAINGNVVFTSGDFSVVPLGLIPGAVFHDFTFAPSLPVGGVTPLWTITLPGPSGFSFDLTNLNIEHQAINGLNLSGSGIMHGSLFADTPYFWSFSADRTCTHFTSGVCDKVKTDSHIGFSSDHSPVPEPTSLLLLGAGLAGLGIVRRKIARG